jgi:hypothetical protein
MMIGARPRGGNPKPREAQIKIFMPSERFRAVSRSLKHRYCKGRPNRRKYDFKLRFLRLLVI